MPEEAFKLKPQTIMQYLLTRQEYEDLKITNWNRADYDKWSKSVDHEASMFIHELSRMVTIVPGIDKSELRQSISNFVTKVRELHVANTPK